jgi:hypothetical protein
MQALRINRHFSNKAGDRVMEKDWDVLILLDGCRYDTFAKYNQLDGELSKVRSLGSHSTEFIEQNFEGGNYHDTVYVSANPHVESLKGEKVFHDIVDVFDWGWDEDYQTVLPETMVEATIDAADEYPDKRIISHFMQPHTPFIGETGRRITHAGITGEGAGKSPETEATELSLWMRLRYRLASEEPEVIRQAYKENLQLVFPHIREIQDSVVGKVVVSADHGNMFGERMRPLPVKMWGHPPGIDHPALTEVPWFEMAHSTRRGKVAEPPVEQVEKTAEPDVQQQLRALGYT